MTGREARVLQQDNAILGVETDPTSSRSQRRTNRSRSLPPALESTDTAAQSTNPSTAPTTSTSNMEKSLEEKL